MASDADMEDYGFVYSDEEPEEQDVDIENQYYNSKGLVETDPEGALAGFAEVVSMEPEKAEWGFKALKQTVKLHYHLGRDFGLRLILSFARSGSIWILKELHKSCQREDGTDDQKTDYKEQSIWRRYEENPCQ
ncbi:hypothetical protein CRYUN_Cryun11dG0090800 [Craigia yunnanensis]